MDHVWQQIDRCSPNLEIKVHRYSRTMNKTTTVILDDHHTGKKRVSLFLSLSPSSLTLQGTLVDL